MPELYSLEILDSKPEHIEIAGWSDTDLMYVRGIALKEGVNGNNALIEKDDIEKSYDTLVGKPIKIRFVNNNPTTHGLNLKTGEFDEIVKAVGVIKWAYPVEDEITKETSVVFEGIVWQKYYPEVAGRLRQLHREGNLKFSWEATRDEEYTPEGNRHIYNIVFHGLAIVENPAEPEARSLMVAELLNEGGNEKVELNEVMKKLTDATTEIANLKTDILAKDGTITTLEGTLSTTKEELAEANGQLKTITVERDSFKTKIEEAEKVQCGNTRLEKIQKYGDTTETAESLGSLSKEDWLSKLEETVSNFNPEVAENKDGVTGAVHVSVGSKTKLSNKEQLLQVCEGLLK